MTAETHCCFRCETTSTYGQKRCMLHQSRPRPGRNGWRPARQAGARRPESCFGTACIVDHLRSLEFASQARSGCLVPRSRPESCSVLPRRLRKRLSRISPPQGRPGRAEAKAARSVTSAATSQTCLRPKYPRWNRCGWRIAPLKSIADIMTRGIVTLTHTRSLLHPGLPARTCRISSFFVDDNDSRYYRICVGRSLFVLLACPEIKDPLRRPSQR